MHALGHCRDLLDVRTVIRIGADAGVHQTTELCVCVCAYMCPFELNAGCLTERLWESLLLKQAGKEENPKTMATTYLWLNTPQTAGNLCHWGMALQDDHSKSRPERVPYTQLVPSFELQE